MADDVRNRKVNIDLSALIHDRELVGEIVSDDEVCADIQSVPIHRADDAFRLVNKLHIIDPIIQTATGNVVMGNNGVCVVNKTVGQATTVTLSARSGRGHFAFVKDGKGDAGTNAITIVPDGTAHNTTIDGAANFVLNANYGSVMFMNNGTEWNVMLQKNGGASFAQTPSQATLTTVGAGTILGSMIGSTVLLRTGSTTAFTDTTDTAANLVASAAMAGLQIGQSFTWTYQNSTPAVATLVGGVGVAGAATFGIVGPGAWARFLWTYTALNTFTVTQVEAGDNWIGLPSTSYSTGTTTTTFTAAEMTGGKLTVYTSTAATPGSIATATATAMFAAIPGAYVGLKWIFRVINDAATNSLTVTADASVTLSGKTTYVATPFGSMDFEMTFTSATAATMRYIGGGQSTTV